MSAQRKCRWPLPEAPLWPATLAALMTVLALSPAQSQSTPSPTITIATIISAEPATQTALPLSLAPSEAVPFQSYLRLRGLPPTIALSEGHSVAPGAWAVALAALPNLKLIVPGGLSGRSEIVITLVALDGTALAETKSSLIVAAAHRDPAPPPIAASILRAGAPLQPAPEAAPPPGPVSNTGQPLTPHDLERAQRLLVKGDQELLDGNVAAARLLYRRAADAGLPRAAMALAATYDAAELAKLKLRGIPADPQEAQRWYERARQLGAGGASVIAPAR